MIDGETYGILLVAFGIFIVGVGAVISLFYQDYYITFFQVGVVIVCVGIILHIGSDFYYEYKKWRSVR